MHEQFFQVTVRNVGTYPITVRRIGFPLMWDLRFHGRRLPGSRWPYYRKGWRGARKIPLITAWLFTEVKTIPVRSAEQFLIPRNLALSKRNDWDMGAWIAGMVVECMEGTEEFKYDVVPDGFGQVGPPSPPV